MQFDEKMNEVLTNFSQINSSIVFKPGNVVSTIKPSKAVFAMATVSNQFDKTFAIYNLNQLLALLSLCESPEIDILDNHMLIRQGSETVRYTFCDPDLVITPPEKKLTLPSVDVEFSLPNATLSRVRKFAQTMSSPQIAVTGDGETIYMEALNTDNSADNVYRIKVGKTTNKFRMVFMQENLDFLPRDYNVQISAKGLAYFEASDVEYWVAVEQNTSHFEE